MRRFIYSGLSVAALAAVLALTSVAPASAQWRRGGGGWRGGPGIGAGIVAGALLGGAIAANRPYYGDSYYAPGPYYAPGYAPAPVYGDQDDSYCAQRYRSYDPGSGTFLGYDGLRHPCP